MRERACVCVSIEGPRKTRTKWVDLQVREVEGAERREEPQHKVAKAAASEDGEGRVSLALATNAQQNSILIRRSRRALYMLVVIAVRIPMK